MRSLNGTILLIALNILNYLAQVYYGATDIIGLKINVIELIDMGALVTPLMRSPDELWRLFAAQYLHLGLLHITFNMVGLKQLGPFVEQLFGPYRMIAIYTICGVGGYGLVSLLYVSGITVEPRLVAGASAGVLGLVGLIAGLAGRWYLMFRSNSAMQQLKRLGNILLLQMILDMVIPQVSSTAHIGGALTGALIGFIIAPRLSAKFASDYA